MKTNSESFWQRVAIGDPNECWLWHGQMRKDGYGHWRVGSRTDGTRRVWLAHRVAYALAFDVEPGDLCVCHHCDNPSCVNPAHLFLGTHADNMADRSAKGRTRDMRGERNPAAKVSLEDVKAIRDAAARDVPTMDLARRYGLCRTAVRRIVRGKNWVSA